MKRTIVAMVAVMALNAHALAQTADQNAADKLGGEAGATSSGPGVKGFPNTRTGPATRVPGGEESGATGAGAGDGRTTEHTTTPSQDSSGVKGFPNTRTGPATRAPGEAEDQGSGKQ